MFDYRVSRNILRPTVGAPAKYAFVDSPFATHNAVVMYDDADSTNLGYLYARAGYVAEQLYVDRGFAKFERALNPDEMFAVIFNGELGHVWGDTQIGHLKFQIEWIMSDFDPSAITWNNQGSESYEKLMDVMIIESYENDDENTGHSVNSGALLVIDDDNRPSGSLYGMRLRIDQELPVDTEERWYWGNGNTGAVIAR